MISATFRDSHGRQYYSTIQKMAGHPPFFVELKYFNTGTKVPAGMPS